MHPAIIFERIGLGRHMAAHLRSPAGFVDIIAGVNDQVRALFSHIAIGVEIALLVMRARTPGDLHRVHARSIGRSGQRATGRARHAARMKAEEILSSRRQAVNLGMDGMTPIGQRPLDAGAHDKGEGFVFRQFPAHIDGFRRHAAIGIERIRREARPQHEPVRGRLARRDAQGKRIIAKDRRGALRHRHGAARRQGGGGAGGGGGQDETACPCRSESADHDLFPCQEAVSVGFQYRAGVTVLRRRDADERLAGIKRKGRPEEPPFPVIQPYRRWSS